MAVPLPPGYHSVNPYFVVTNVERFIEFLVEVLQGVEVGEREIRDDGAIDHADVMIGDSLIMMSESSEQYPARPSVSFAYVDDVDATFGRALLAGSRVILVPTEQPWGDRVAGIFDPFDNRWWIGTHLRTATSSSPSPATA
ncbi:MAG: VOC family protein [Nakamurella sp.]